MTVSSSPRKAGPFLGNGVTTVFPFTFKVFTTADITLTLTDADGVDTTLTLGSDYSVATNADQDNTPGGTITYPLSGSPMSAGQTLIGIGSVAASQGADITNAGRFLAQVVENALDKLTILAQQVLEKVNRALAVPVSESTIGPLPTAANRASKFLGFDASGNPIALSGTGADAGLRVDLATAGGAALVGSSSVLAGSIARTLNAALNDFSVSVKWFGAQGDGVADDTAAIQAAENAVALLVTARYPSLFFPAGDYKCNFLTWKKVASWVGSEVENTRLVYNGPDNTADSYIVGLAAGAGAVPWAGFYNMSFIGFDSTSTANPCAAHGIYNLGTNLDWGFKLENLHFANFFDDALQLRGATSVPVNLFMNRLRWDAVGGFAIYLGSNISNSGTPVVLDQFTLDNNLSANMITKMTAQGRYDGSRWGKGIMRIEDGVGLGVRITNARVELNKKLIAHNGGYALVYSNQTVANTRCLVSIENIGGTGRNDQPLSVVRDVTGRTDMFHRQISMSSYARLFADDTKPERDRYHNDIGQGFIGALTTQPLGLGIAGHSLEYRPNPPEQVAGNVAAYKFGDIVFNTTLGAGRPVAWQCKSPTTGFAVGTTSNITAAAVVTAASAVVAVPSSTFANLAVGLNVTVVGAGAAGVDLSTRVTAADEVANTITLADVPATSVNPATIKFTACQFAPVLYAPGVSTDRGNNNVTVNLGIDAPTQYFNTPLTSDKAVTLGTSASSLGTVAQASGRITIVRTAASTGAFNLNVAHNGGTKALTPGTWADFDFNGLVWILARAGTL